MTLKVEQQLDGRWRLLERHLIRRGGVPRAIRSDTIIRVCDTKAQAEHAKAFLERAIKQPARWDDF